MTLLSGHFILLVEDEPLIALDVQQCLEEEGATVHCALTLMDAERLAEQPDLTAAVLDYQLKGQVGRSVCDRLSARGIPFLFHTGRHARELIEWQQPVLSKPATCDDIVTQLRTLLETDLPRN